jgi:hypothetical protein
MISGPARSSWGDPYNPFDAYGGERGSLLMPSSREWPTPNTSRILEETREGINDFSYLTTLEKAVELAGDGAEGRAAAEFLAGLRKEVSGTLADYVEPTADTTWRTRAKEGWTAERYNSLRRDAIFHLLAIRKALALPVAGDGGVVEWP